MPGPSGRRGNTQLGEPVVRWYLTTGGTNDGGDLAVIANEYINYGQDRFPCIEVANYSDNQLKEMSRPLIRGPGQTSTRREADQPAKAGQAALERAAWPNIPQVGGVPAHRSRPPSQSWSGSPLQGCLAKYPPRGPPAGRVITGAQPPSSKSTGMSRPAKEG
ncbi:unnamed protein product [Clonostachys rosea]|uniref:Uncharacterized protein n=1 Tax=Bionectria ochroleuca TaxID=29856 RepID=A0ABY6UKY1_BIOOC|nr:unnamed protein product [Clonostachys rosea]